MIETLRASGLNEKVMIDFSHSNSQKQFKKQLQVGADVAGQIASGNKAIFGVMAESYLVEGRQDLIGNQAQTYGQSITDACIGWEDTEVLLARLNDAVVKRMTLC